MMKVCEGDTQETCQKPDTDLNRFKQTEMRTYPLGHKLKGLIDNLPSSGLTLTEMRDIVGQEGLLLLTAFLALVFMVPVSIPGISILLGVTILGIGISRLLNCDLWLPKRFAHRVLPADRLRTALNQSVKWFHRLERLSRPHRLEWLVSSGLMATANNGALIIGALLLMAPLGLIPFTNTLPALALLFLAIGLLQRDGLCILIGHFLNLATILKFAVLILGGSEVIHEWFQRFVGE